MNKKQFFMFMVPACLAGSFSLFLTDAPQKLGFY
jgi:hypothetical protein